MPFEWYEADVPPIGAKKKSDAMYEAELAQRAALLQRLGYSEEAAVSRLRTNVVWDFELNGGPPPHLDRVKSIVERVYARHGTIGGGPPTV